MHDVELYLCPGASKEESGSEVHSYVEMDEHQGSIDHCKDYTLTSCGGYANQNATNVCKDTKLNEHSTSMAPSSLHEYGTVLGTIDDTDSNDYDDVEIQRKGAATGQDGGNMPKPLFRGWEKQRR